MFRNTPNLLTAARLVAVPFIAAAIVNGRFSLALVLTFIAGVTDGLDGFLARRFGWTSRTGAYLDPIADKLLLVTLFVVLGEAGLIPRWLVALVIGRDILILLMVAAGFAFTRIRSFPPSSAGKLSTIVQVATCAGILMMRAMGVQWARELTPVLIAATAAVTIWSGFDYARRGLAMLRRERIDVATIRR